MAELGVKLDSSVVNFRNHLSAIKGYNRSINEIFHYLENNKKDLKFLFQYLNKLQEWKYIGNDIDWVNFESIISQHFNWETVDITDLMIQLYRANSFRELCLDYALSKGLEVYQEMVEKTLT